jgi:hypothetical protein
MHMILSGVCGKEGYLRYENLRRRLGIIES